MSDIYIKGKTIYQEKTEISKWGYRITLKAKKCATCWNEFEWSSTKRYCSAYCAYRNQTRGRSRKNKYWAKKETICSVCWEKYIGTWLSNICWSTCRARKDAWIEKVEKTCVVCWKKFETFWNRNIMCSLKCREERKISQIRSYVRDFRKKQLNDSNENNII